MKKIILVSSIMSSLFLSSCAKINTQDTKAMTPSPAIKIVQRKSFEPEMVKIPKGSFLMGCVSNKNCGNNEKPVHRVNINAFSMGKTEVTFEQWDACVKAGGCKLKPSDEGNGRGKHPVVNVDWDNIQEYLRWLNKKTNKTYRLPTEAEWEYAARAGTTTQYWWGNQKPSCNKKDINGANFNGGKGSSCSNQKPAIVASYRANPWGLYDVHGNVSEITCSASPGFSWSGMVVARSKYNGSETKCLKDSDKIKDDRGYRKMPLALRSNSWESSAKYQRIASRHYIGNDFPLYQIGFRVASD